MSVPHAVPKLLLGLALAGVALATPAAASAATPGPLKVESSGLCADVLGGISNTAAPVFTWGCNGTAAQAFELTSAGQLRVLGGKRCLEARGGGKGSGTLIDATGCKTGPAQQWKYRPADRAIIGVGSGICLDVAAIPFSPNGRLQLHTCHGKANQRWSQPAGAAVDTAAPTPPGKPVISNLTCNSATLTWTGSTDDTAVTEYDVYHDGQLMKSVPAGTLSTELTLNPGATWGFYVNARDAAGNVSQASPTLSVAIPQCVADTQAPSVPTGLSGTASGTAATLRWTASTDNIGVSAYDIYRDDVKVGSTGETTYTDSGLKPTTAYRYSVAARDAQANASARTAAITLTSGAGCTSAICAVTQPAADDDIPWGLVTLPDGSIIYSRRDAHDLIRMDAAGVKTTVGTVPNAQSTDGEGGLLGLAVTSGFPTTDPWIYIQHTSPTDNRVVRIKYAGGKLDTASLQVLLSGIGRNKYHNGGRLRFGPDGKLYIATGDAQNGDYAQDVNNLAGKILRMNPDGSRPSDNPYGNYVWSLGHRNPQGLAFDSRGRLWAQEFGNFFQDETNLIEKGGNYGWPACEGTIGDCGKAEFKAPKWTYGVGDASCSGLAIVRDVVYIACLRGQRVYRHVISGDTLTGNQSLFQGTYGRIRTVEPTRDGGLWMTTSNNGDKDSVANNSNEKILKVTLGS